MDVVITSKRYTYKNRFANMVHITILLRQFLPENILALAQLDVLESLITFHKNFWWNIIPEINYHATQIYLYNN